MLYAIGKIVKISIITSEKGKSFRPIPSDKSLKKPTIMDQSPWDSNAVFRNFLTVLLASLRQPIQS